MIKLRKIISHLDEDLYKTIEDTLKKNKADNFLFLLQSYRKEINDPEILESLDLNSNSYYVLKSRLYDKIQSQLSGDIHLNREELLKKLNQIPEMCVKEPREVATAFLQKLEKDLLEYDMHTELLVVYSALKKIHLYSEKYFYYSQLFNKHIAFSLSLEKSEEILGNFNRVLGQYDFSRSSRLVETLWFLRREINDHYALNKSRQVEIIKNFIEIQLGLFSHSDSNKEIDIESLLNQTQKIIGELPETAPHKNWQPALDHLFFEYHCKNGNRKAALALYSRINANLDTLLLSGNISMVSRFLVSKISFLCHEGVSSELAASDTGDIIYDSDDMHTCVLLGLYSAMISYYAKNYKEAANKLNKILNENSFKDFFHINTDIKLTLAYIYIQLKEYDLADSIIKGVYRKIKTEKITCYANVLDIIKVFELEIKDRGGKTGDKQRDSFMLFTARNKNESELLTHLISDLKQKYS
jgi:hypothetical protein